MLCNGINRITFLESQLLCCLISVEGVRQALMCRLKRLKVHTWAGLDAGCPEGIFGIRVGDHQVGFGVVQQLRRTHVLTGSIIIKVPAGLDRKASQTSGVVQNMSNLESHVPSSEVEPQVTMWQQL